MGYDWDFIAGVSVGALNGGMLAMRKYTKLWEHWSNISNDKVYTGKLTVWYALYRLLLGRKSVLDNGPLKAMIEREFDENLLAVELRIGAVDLFKGGYVAFKPGDTTKFTDAVLASTAIPIYWEPVDVPPYGPMVDGGVRNVTPLGDVIEHDPDEIVIINCRPPDPRVLKDPPGNLFKVGTRSLDILTNEVFLGDVREFIRINRNVQEAAAGGVTLHSESGRPYKFFEHKLIEPTESLGGTIDFSQKSTRRSMKAGWAAAAKVLGDPPSGPVPFPGF